MLLEKRLPDWIQGYMAYTAESRSPDAYHIWVALTTLSGAIRRKVFFSFEYFLLYPNIYVVLVGPPGKCKKTTAMRIGRQFLSKVPGVHFTVDSTSRERLILDMSQSYADGHSSMTAYSSELASLLTTSGTDMIAFLTDIYDCPDEWTHRTKSLGGGTNRIKAPYLTLIAGTTPDWISRSLPLDTVGIGLAARTIFVYQDTPRIRPPFPSLSEEQRVLGEILLADLTQISTLSGECVMTPEARDWYVAWDLEHQKRDVQLDLRLAGYHERKPIHLIKVAMLINAARDADLQLKPSDLETALTLLEDLEPSMARTFAAVGRNPLSADIFNVVDLVTAVPGITYAQILDKFKHSLRKEEMDEVLHVLSVTGRLKVAQEKDGPHYYPGEAKGKV